MPGALLVFLLAVTYSVVSSRLRPGRESVVEPDAPEAGADAVSLINTFVGMAVDWQRRKPILGNVTGGLSGPAIKPLALRLVWRVARNVSVPVIGIGGIATLDDVMEFLGAGASAVQLGTINFYDPTASVRAAEGLPAALGQLGATSVREVVGTLERPLGREQPGAAEVLAQPREAPPAQAPVEARDEVEVELDALDRRLVEDVAVGARGAGSGGT